MSKDLKDVKILILGEIGVGKTSLILSLVSEQFLDENDDPTFELPARLEPITIPAEVTLEKVPGLIIDFSSREQNDEELSKEIEKSNVICLVYSLGDDDSKERLSSYWLPKIEEIEEALSGNKSTQKPVSPSSSFTANNLADISLISTNDHSTSTKIAASTSRRPIVLVANKSDLVINPNALNQDPFVWRLVLDHPQIETCVQCSAKTLKNVPEVFYYAQKSVLYPTWPVYDADKKELTPQAVRCFTRVFRLCDNDNDGVLSDRELNDFQLKCFGVKLNSQALQEVKLLLSEDRGSLANNEITLSGFLLLQALFFKKGRHETAWTVLKKFGYDKNLTMSRDYASISLKAPPNCSIELSLQCFEFLQYLFKKHDRDNDSCLNRSELADFFASCPITNPWGRDVHNTVETNLNGEITLCGFLSQWVLTTYFDYKTTVELLAYLGYNYYYEDNQLSALIVSRPKEVDLMKKQTHRNAFLCYVYGRKKCGKTSFLQGLLGRDLEFQSKLSPDEITRWSCNLVQFQNVEKYLILKEINSSDLELHEVYPPDVVILLYDITDPNSFAFIADIFLSVYKDRPIPCVLVGTKCDQVEISQNYPLNVEKFAELYRLPPPQFYSSSSAILPNCDIYAKIVAIATYPKMYPMRSQIWSFFQKLGAAATSSSTTISPHRRPIRLGVSNMAANKPLTASTTILNPLAYFSRTANLLRPQSASDPDSMFLRYSFLTATCVTVAFILYKLLK